MTPTIFRFITVIVALLLCRIELRQASYQSYKLQMQRMEGETRKLAHGFSNVLQVMMGSACMMLEDLEPGSPHRADLQTMVDSAHEGAQLTEKLRNLSRTIQLPTRKPHTDYYEELSHSVVNTQPPPH